MALLSDLVATCAAHRVDSEGTLHLFARRLREAGRISKAGRGRGAAHMTFLDAARFLIACAATDHPERAPDAERAFSGTVFSDASRVSHEPGDRFELTAETTPTLDVAVAHFLEALATGEIDAKANPGPHPETVRLPAIFWLVVRRSHVSATLRANDSVFHFQHPTLYAAVRAPDYFAQKPLLAALERETFAFRTGKNLTAELDSALLRAIANLIAGAGEQ